jgi:hypothetical protein
VPRARQRISKRRYTGVVCILSLPETRFALKPVCGKKQPIPTASAAGLMCRCCTPRLDTGFSWLKKSGDNCCIAQTMCSK